MISGGTCVPAAGPGAGLADPINPAKIGGGPDLPSIPTPFAAGILKDGPPGTGIRGGLKRPVEVMGDAVGRLVGIAGAIEQQDALARQPLDRPGWPTSS